MPKPGSISRRIESSLTHLANNELEESLIHFFPALDKTAKIRYPRMGVGQRIKRLITDHEAIITAVAINNIITGATFSGLTIAEAMYKLGRTSILHEGELDSRLTFDNNTGLSIGHSWNLNNAWIFGLILCVILSKENLQEYINPSYAITLWGVDYSANDLWGREDMIYSILAKWGSQS
jgi:hypothetical protein